MAIPKNITGQRDFSAGELDPELKRGEEMPEYKAGARQMQNLRILNSRKVKNRCGRRVLFKESVRIEEFEIAPGVTYYIAFPQGFVHIINSAGTQVLSVGQGWTASNAKDVVWCIFDKSIYITFGGLVPLVLTWDGATTWTAAVYAVTVTAGSQYRSPFYRISPKGVTMQPGAQVGTGVAVTFSAGMNLVVGMVGVRMRFINRQIEIASVASPTTGTINVLESLPGSQVLTYVAGTVVSRVYCAGDIVQGSVTNSRGVVTARDDGARTITVQLLTAPGPAVGNSIYGSVAFTTADAVIGPGGGLTPTAVSGIGVPQPVTFWDDEVMNNYRGWPSSCFSDQSRLGFCDFPAVPSGISWSAVGLPNDLYVGANPDDAIFELAPNRSRVLYVVPGMDSSEFVFCTNRLYYIPINVTNPLKPGSVQFSTVSEDECGQVHPRRAGEFIVYTTGGLNQLMAVRIFGAYTRAYKVDGISELSAHLFTTIKAIAIMTASASFAERYIFVLNTAGDVVVGKYSVDKSGALEGMVGWAPWRGGSLGNTVVQWVSCKGANTLFTSSYSPNAIAGVSVAELLDDSRYLDASQLYNTQPSGLPIPGGKGPLWWLAGGSVDLMDGPLGTRMMGTYQIDANGFLIPQFNGGEDLTSVNLVVGQAWSATLEPFLPAAQPGQDVGQRMKKRRVARVNITVKDSTGFLFARLKSGKTIPGGPALGTIMGQTRVPAWNSDDVVTNPPTLREQTYSFRPLGRDDDPRMCVIKDTPGPITIEEFAMDASV